MKAFVKITLALLIATTFLPLDAQAGRRHRRGGCGGGSGGGCGGGGCQTYGGGNYGGGGYVSAPGKYQPQVQGPQQAPQAPFSK